LLFAKKKKRKKRIEVCKAPLCSEKKKIKGKGMQGES
jgi:hypothetical protein